MAPRLAGAALLAATAAIHLDLYVASYKLIPTIGFLFLLQVIAGFIIALAVLASRGLALTISAVIGAGYMISTLAGYLLSLWIGLFGFRETRTTAGVLAGIAEVVGFGILLYLALHTIPEHGPLAPIHRVRGMLPGGHQAAVSALSVVAAIVLGISIATATTASSGSSSVAAQVGGGSSTGAVGLHMTIKDFKFFPANPVLTPGEKVEVTNFDSAPHSVTSGIPNKFKGTFTTPLLAQGKTGFFIAPTKPGKYPFYCLIHFFMTGVITVK
jgi:plastocyanin